MNARTLGGLVAALILFALAWAGIARMTWRQDATAVPAAGSVVGDVRATAAGSREPAATAAGAAVAPTSGATAHEGGTASAGAAASAASANGVAVPSAEPAQAPGEGRVQGHDDRGSAGRAASAAASVRYPVDGPGLQRAIASVVPEMRECYAAWRKQRPGLAGAMRVHMTIEVDPKADSTAKGEAHVTRADIVDDALGHAAVAGCVQNALDELTFEPPAGGKADVVLPLQFAGADDEPQRAADQQQAPKTQAVRPAATRKPVLAASGAKEQAR